MSELRLTLADQCVINAAAWLLIDPGAREDEILQFILPILPDATVMHPYAGPVAVALTKLDELRQRAEATSLARAAHARALLDLRHASEKFFGWRLGLALAAARPAQEQVVE